jgi:hypothetical protein
MMRPVEQDDVVVARFDDASDAPFALTEAVWAIGGKWEQQFMGEVDGQQTLLPGAWQVASQTWLLTGWDGWQTPEPLVRCNGCHTVGLDVSTGEFVEPNIGCESCHGPASRHVQTFGLSQMPTSVDAQICGQCHTRGKSVNGKHHFPVGYRPGDSLAEHFNALAPYPDQNSSQWWGNGHPRKRHQQYFGWQQGGHSESLSRLKNGYDGRYGEVGPDCLVCHSGEAAIDRGRSDYELEDVEHPVTCAVCHNSHDALEQPRLACSSCHTQGAFYHQTARNENHVPQPRAAHADCVGCHMPVTGQIGTAFNSHSHAPGVIPPGDTEKYQVPNSCANGGCHADTSNQLLQELWQAHYGPPVESEIKEY